MSYQPKFNENIYSLRMRFFYGYQPGLRVSCNYTIIPLLVSVLPKQFSFVLEHLLQLPSTNSDSILFLLEQLLSDIPENKIDITAVLCNFYQNVRYFTLVL